MKVLKLIAVVGLACLLAQPGVADVRKSGLTGAAFLKSAWGLGRSRSARPIRPWPATSTSYFGTQPARP